MRLLAITLALASLSSLSLAHPTPPSESIDMPAPHPAPFHVHAAVPEKASKQVIAAKLKKRQTSRKDILARQAARGLLTARKGPKRAVGGDVQTYFKRDGADEDEVEEEEEEEGVEREREAEVKCEGRQFAYFANVSWKTPTESQVCLCSQHYAPWRDRGVESTVMLMDRMSEGYLAKAVRRTLAGNAQGDATRRKVRLHTPCTPCATLCCSLVI